MRWCKSAHAEDNANVLCRCGVLPARTLTDISKVYKPNVILFIDILTSLTLPMSMTDRKEENSPEIMEEKCADVSSDAKWDENAGQVDDLYIDPKEEAKLVHKLDLWLMPLFATVYFLSSLDRSNIGNAGPVGLEVDLKMTSAQFSTAVSIFYAPYVVIETPAVLLMRRMRPHIYLSVLIFCWSIITLCGAFVQSYHGLIATRVLLGTFEGGFFPCLSVYITLTYKREEQARRIAYLFGSSALSGAFGGLICTGILKIHSGSLANWRYLYIIEGSISIMASLWMFFALPDEPNQLKALTDREREIMRIRSKQREEYMGSQKFEWPEVRKGLLDPKTILSVIIQFCQDTILYGFSTFLPSILKKGLGYSGLEAQYLSVPVYILAGILFYLSAFASDKLQKRGPIFTFYNIFGLVGYILLLSVGNDKVKYFACYLIAFSLYTGTGLNIAWITNNVAPHYRRATAVGANQTFGNVAGAIAGQVYRNSPYVLGHAFSLGCVGLSMICATLMTLFLHRENRIKNKVLDGEIEDPRKDRTGDRALDFKYCY